MFMNKILAYAMAGVFMGTVLMGTAGAASSEYDKGKALYFNKCQICHGSHGDGNGPAGVSLTPQPRNFTDPNFWKGNVEEKITITVTNGFGPMPAFKLKPEDIKAIFYYISHTFKK